MADSLVPLLLNKGLDLVTPPVQIESGALIDCLNYELTDVAGYRRIDGYERYDGYPNGAIYEFFRLEITADVEGNQVEIVPGSIISRVGDDVPTIDIGVVLGGPFEVTEGETTRYYYDVAPTADITQFVLSEALLTLADGVSNLELIAGGYLSLLEADTELGSIFVVTPPGGTAFLVTVGVAITEGRALYDAIEYLEVIREYAQVLRDTVEEAPGEIVGLHWYDDRLLAAVNAFHVNMIQASGDPVPVVGTLLRWNGTVYRLVDITTITEDTDNVYRLHLLPVDEDATVDDDLVEVEPDGTASTIWVEDVSTQEPSSINSKVAVLGYFNNPDVAPSRGFTYLTPAYMVDFDTGTYTDVLGLPLTLDMDATDPDGEFWVVGDAGATVFKVRLMSAVQSDGDWVAGTAEGKAQLVLIESISGDRDYPEVGDVLHNAYPTSGTTDVLTITGYSGLATLPGSATLDLAGTRYVWDTYNFYGQSSSLTAYGATGCSRAFWANKNGYSTIEANPDVTLDMPRYLAYHVGKLALAYQHGSVLTSVVGEPTNFMGVQGAAEYATGDDITGLLEMPGDTLAVLGRKSIRTLRGNAEDGQKLETISSTAGCYDYSAVLVGQNGVFAGINGITTMEQTSAYGNFANQDLSYKISTWLRPKLATNRPGFERGGILCAYPVRNKSQYRLILNSGEFVILTFTADGPKLMFGNHAISGRTRIPYAISSGVSRFGLERIHAAWTDTELRRQAYELDVGWGFDGRNFRSFFEVAHTFNQGGAQFMGIERVRMYGQGYGVATLDVKAAGIEDDFNQAYHDQIQDISMPRNPDLLYDRMRPVTAIVDHANWGLAIKLRVGTTIAENSTETEPSHICQVILAHVRTEGAQDA